MKVNIHALWTYPLPSAASLAAPFVYWIFYYLPVKPHRKAPHWRVQTFVLILFNAAVFLFLRPVYQSPDGVGYFSYLWSIFSEGTLSFSTVYQRYHMAIPLTRTSQGWLANNWSFGTALLWVPFYEVGRLGRYFFGSTGPLSAREALCLANFGSMTFGAFYIIAPSKHVNKIGWKQVKISFLFLLSIEMLEFTYQNIIHLLFCQGNQKVFRRRVQRNVRF